MNPLKGRFSDGPAKSFSRFSVFLFFTSLLLLGLWVFRDYGVHWDYAWNKKNAAVQLDYYRDFPRQTILKDEQREDFHWVTYKGPAFEMLILTIERRLGLKDSRDMIFLQHGMTFLSFYFGMIFFFLLCRRHLGNPGLSLLGCLMLLLTPRIFAHAFYNSVDIPFLALFTASVYTLTVFLDRKTVPSSAVHALTCALAIAVRNAGFLLVALTFLGLGLEALREKSLKQYLRQILLPAAVYIFLTVQLLPVFWPYLWSTPPSIFPDFPALINSLKGNIRHLWDAETLYLGKLISGSQIPWHYNFVWMALTIPPAYSLMFVLGLPVTLRPVFRRPAVSSTAFRDNWILLCWLFVPLIAPAALKSTLFDDWRHHYFIYPAFLLIALAGIRRGIVLCREKPSVRPWGLALSLILGANMLTAAGFMVRNHPYQNVYFNALAGKNLRMKFDLDYWGLSYRQGLEYILSQDPRPAIKVVTLRPAGYLNSHILEPRQRARLQYVSADKADYFLTEYRWKPEGYPDLEEFHSITVEGEKILTIYRLKPEPNPES